MLITGVGDVAARLPSAAVIGYAPATLVEVALKAARKWGNKVKGIPQDEVEIIACEGNFQRSSVRTLPLPVTPVTVWAARTLAKFAVPDICTVYPVAVATAGHVIV